MTKQNRVTDTENQQVVVRGQEGGWKKEIGEGDYKVQTLGAKYVTGMKCTVQGIQSIPLKYICMLKDCSQTYPLDHFEMYRNIKLLCCVTETNIVLQVNYTSKTSKKNSQKRDQICGHQKWGVGERKLDEDG